MLFCKRKRLVTQGKSIPKDCDAAVPRPPDKHRRRDHWRGHQAIGGLVVLIHADAIEPKFGCELQFIQVAIVERMADNWIEVIIGQNNPDAAVLLANLHVQISVRHKMKAHNLHCAFLSVAAEDEPPNVLRSI